MSKVVIKPFIILILYCSLFLYYDINSSVFLPVLFRIVSAMGLNSPLPVAVSFTGSTPHSSTRNNTTLVALFVDSSQLVGNSMVFIGRLSVCPCITAFLFSCFINVPIFLNVSFPVLLYPLYQDQRV